MVSSEWVEGKWGRLWLGRRCGCRCCTYRLREWYCGLCTGWSRGGEKGKIGRWIVTPKCYGPFKVLWASPTNCKLQLPPQMKIHPVFHNSLLKPYIETSAHGPNFAQPPPEIVGGEEGHYEIEKILQECPTRNRKSTQYLVK